MSETMPHLNQYGCPQCGRAWMLSKTNLPVCPNCNRELELVIKTIPARDQSELDRLRQENQRLVSEVVALNQTITDQKWFLVRIREDNKAHKDCLEVARDHCEQAFHHLSNGKSSSKHDPSWIRPLTMSKGEMIEACQQSYHHIHAALTTINQQLEKK